MGVGRQATRREHDPGRQDLRFARPEAAAIARSAVRSYRLRMSELASAGPLDVWYDCIDVEPALAIARQDRAEDLRQQLRADKVRQRTSLRTLPKLTRAISGTRKIIDDPPLMVTSTRRRSAERDRHEGYVQLLPPDRRPLLERYNVLDCAARSSASAASALAATCACSPTADARSPILLQLKEALDAVLAPHVGRSEFDHQGQRVVVGQRLMQAASDIFLGWTSYREHDYYVRQYRDMKGSVNLDALTLSGLASYAQVCGRTLARAHA